MSREAFTKTVRPGAVPINGHANRRDMFCTIKWDGAKLSITGVIGPKANGDADGGCGQIDGGFAHRDPADNDARTTDPIPADAIRYADGWNAERWLDFLDIWGQWHLNDMRAGCKHQMAAGWDKRPIDPDKPTTAYGKHYPGQTQDSWNLLAWVRETEHPDGLLRRACPECGYKYGSAWLTEEVPAEALYFLAALPETDKRPAWS